MLFQAQARLVCFICISRFSLKLLFIQKDEVNGMKGKGKGTADDIFKEINRKKSIAQTGRKMSVDPGQALLSNNVLLYSTANIV